MRSRPFPARAARTARTARTFASIVAILVVAPCILIACGKPAPPQPTAPPPPPAPTYRQAAAKGVTVPGTDTPVTVGVWIENGKDRYHPGDTLTLYFGMRYDGPGQVTVAAPDTAPLVSARVVLEGNSYGMQRGDPTKFFGNDVDSLAAYYVADSRPRYPGYAIAWQPTETQLAALPRRVTVPAPARAREFMGPGWCEVARVEIPHDGVRTWSVYPDQSAFGPVLATQTHLYPEIYFLGQNMRLAWPLRRKQGF